MLLLRSVLTAATVTLVACSNPPPTCSATETAYRVCSDNQVWECPVATAQQLAARKVIDDDCKQQADQVKCILNAKYEQLPMKLTADCQGGGQRCVDATATTDAGVPVGTKVASCQPK